MKAGNIVVIALLVVGLSACKNAEKKASDGDAEKVYTFNIDQTKEYIDLKLTDLAENFKLIPLETTEQSLLGRSEFYVSDQYILAYTGNGVYKFSPEGKFIKKIINVGKGPQEVSVYYPQYFVASNNLLYILDQQHNEYILVYDILAEQFKEPVKKCIPGYWSSLAVNDSGVVIFTPNSPLPADSTYYALVYQNARGEFLSGILNTKRQKSQMNNEEMGYQIASILPSQDGLKTYFNYDDTVYTISQGRLTPQLILEFDTPRKYPPEAVSQKGDRMIQFLTSEAPGFLIANAMVTRDTKTLQQGSYTVVIIDTDSKYVFLDKSSGTSSIIRTYHDNLIDKTQNIVQILKDKKEGVKLPKVLPDNKLIVSYDSFEILDAVEKGITSEDFPKKIVDQLNEISRNLKEEDNPVLLVGELINN